MVRQAGTDWQPAAGRFDAVTICNQTKRHSCHRSPSTSGVAVVVVVLVPVHGLSGSAQVELLNNTLVAA